MSRRSNRRDTNDIARPLRPVELGLDFRDPRPLVDIRRALNPPEPPSSPAADRRTFHPDRRFIPSSLNPMHTLRAMSRDIRHRIAPARKGYDFLNPVHWVIHPRETWVCAKRRARREVMAMLHIRMGIGGRGSGRKQQRRKPRYTEYSRIKCRR